MVIPEGYKQTEVGTIPEDWEVKELHDAFSRLEAGVSVNSDDSIASDYFVLKTSAIRNGKVNTDEIKPVIREDYGRLKCSVQRGAIIISRMNTPAMVGECGYSEEEASNVFLPDRLWQVLPSSSEYDFLWLNYLLNTNKYAMAIRATATGTSNSMKNISKERFLEIKIPKPPIHEQRRIAMCLSDFDKAIEATEKLLAKKKEIKQGAMQELLTGKRRLPEFSGEWKKINLMEESKVKARIGWQGLKKSEYLDNGYAILVTGTDFENGRILWETCHFVDKPRYELDKNIQIKNGDILITKDGSLGKTAIVQGLTKPATLNSGVFVVRPVLDSYSPEFVFYILSSFVFKDFLDKLSAGSTIVHLYQKDLSNFEFEIPPSIEEQQAIATILSDIDNEIAELEQKLVKYRQTKQGMMQQLLTGKIRLTDWSE